MNELALKSEAQAVTIGLLKDMLVELSACTQTMLDQVDYVSGSCRMTEMVGSALEPEVLAETKRKVTMSRLILSHADEHRIAQTIEMLREEHKSRGE
jgi:hypothetical protein